MKVKTPRLHELVGISARRQCPRQRDSARAPAADHESQALALPHQRHAEIEWAEPLPQQLFATAAPLHLHACECRASEIALPVLTAVSGAKGDRDRNVGAGGRKT